MRRFLLFMVATIAASVAVAVAIPSTSRAYTQPWFDVHTHLIVQGNNVAYGADVTNVCKLLPHTGSLTATLVKISPNHVTVVLDVPLATIKLKPGESRFAGGFVINGLSRGHYRATTTAKHVFEANDPIGLLGASTANAYEFNIY